jgi:hypothetical protein
MAYPILGNPKPAFFDSSGSPLASGTITVQNPADSAAKTSYPTADDANASTNGTTSDITLDARGEPTSTQLWGKDGEDYKVIIKDSAGTTVYTLDDIRLPGPTRRALVTAASADATPSVAESDSIRLNDTTITDFDDGEVGDTLYVYGPASATVIVSSNSNIFLEDALSFRMSTEDTLVLKMFEDGEWYEVGRSRNTSSTSNYEAVTGANSIFEGENGKTFFLDSTTGFASTLPAPALGLHYTFIVKTVPTSGSHTIVTTSSANILDGTLLDIVGELVYAADQDVITFVASTCVSGDKVEVVSDGTSWHYEAVSGANGGITTGQT